MSIESMAMALHHSAAKSTDLLILLGIANHDGDGGSWPAIATLAKYARCSERRVTQGIQTLEIMGEITVARNAGGTHTTRNSYRTNHYTILLRCPSDCDGTTQHRPRGEQTSPGVKESAPGVNTPSPPGVKPASPESSLEPYTQPSISADDADAPPPPVESPSVIVNRTAGRLAKIYTDRVPLSNFLAVRGVVAKAIKAAMWGEDEIIAALERLADEGRSVTTDALRYELQGFPGRQSNRERALAAGVEAVRRYAHAETQPDPWEITA